MEYDIIQKTVISGFEGTIIFCIFIYNTYVMSNER